MLQDLQPRQPNWLTSQSPREGRYVLGPVLGKGGMGDVMEAWDVLLCRTVAIKALRNLEPQALVRFMHEAQIQARLVHPNICRIYDVESTEAGLRIAMQLIQGPSLEQVAPSLTRDEAAAIVMQVAEAVHAAHRLQLIHRDIKPSNVLLEREQGGAWIPYLCDFGVAFSVDEPSLTLGRSVMGTPAYMAPEQSRGDRASLGPATDVYALGGTLLAVLLGHPPQPTLDGSAWIPPDWLPKDLEAVLRKCLQASPGERYPTAAALAEDLGRFLRGERTQARARGWRFLPRLPRRGGRLPYVLGSLAGAGLCAASILAFTFHARARDEALCAEFIQDAEGARTDYQAQEMLPLHDLGAARNRVREVIASIQARMAGGGGMARAAGTRAIAQCRLLLGECQEARRSLDVLPAGRAENACLLLRARAAVRLWDPKAPGSEPPALAAGTTDAESALASFLRMDFDAAARHARLAAEAHPALEEQRVLEVAALCAGARLRFRDQDLAGARARFQAAAKACRGYLETWRSSESLRRAYARAAMGLAETGLEDGRDVLPVLEDLRIQCERALTLDPGDPGLLEDWLGSRLLLARFRAIRGQDPAADLADARAFLATRARDLSTPGIQADRMLLHWLLAQERLRRGEDPWPALDEALRNATPASAFNHDYRSDLLAFKARVETLQGRERQIRNGVLARLDIAVSPVIPLSRPPG